MNFIVCPKCKRKLFKQEIIGKLEIICPKCGAELLVEATMKPDIRVSVIKEPNR